MTGTPIRSDAGGATARFSEAQIAAIKRSVFARPTMGAAGPGQTMQGHNGAAGAPFGRPQGPVGAATPQLGAQKAPGAAPARPTAQAAPAQPNAPQGPASGLGALLPLLQLLGPLLSHLLGGGQIGATPRGPG